MPEPRGIMSQQEDVPVIAIDGPSGSGKGTISVRVAEALGFNFLDSGALYRLLGLAARRRHVAFDDPLALAAAAEQLDIEFRASPDGTRILLEGADVTDGIRTEQAGSDASVVAAVPQVRAALLARQRAFRTGPGLVADGRDMGTAVFPTADLKIFLTASCEERARRRHNQLSAKGIDVRLPDLVRDLEARDARDRQRSASPLEPATDAVVIDTTHMGIDEVVDRVLALWRGRQPEISR